MRAKFVGLTLTVGLSLTACTRVPSTFSLSDVDSAPAAASRNLQSEQRIDIDRLNQIEAKIDESLARLEAAFDPNAPEANLDKLVENNETIASLSPNSVLTHQQLIDLKFDEKNKALINDELTGNLDNIDDDDSATNINSLEARRAAQVNQTLDEAAANALKEEADKEETEPAADLLEDTHEETERMDTESISESDGTRDSLAE